jgi:murein DD-endopeptidase MepM/ murein hydrolase activator NlpD|uniref:M23 family metallopeptidase n=1 Tax=Polaribacter sp. TaxID=1920175 RepID=UPI00404763EA
MAKVKYYYDADTLSYRKIERRKKEVYQKGTLIFLAILLIAFFGFIIFSQFLMSPNERAQKRELDNLKLHYDLLNKRIEETSNILTEIQQRDNNIYRVFFEANPIPEEQRTAGFGGVNRYKSLEGFDNSAMIQKATKDIDVLSKQLVVQSKSLDEIVSLAKEKEKMLASLPAIQPVSNEFLTRMASGYGWRNDPFTKARKFHRGMDFTAPQGTPVYATGDGVVLRADANATGYGKHVRIDHGFGYVTLYGHMTKFVVKRKQKIKRGDLLGYVGSTGRSKAPHLHYEVRKNGQAINPINFYYGSLTPEEFNAMLKIAELEGQSYD